MEDLIKCLHSLAAQTVRANEIIIIDSSTTPLSEQELFTKSFNKQIFEESKLIYEHTQPGLTYQRNCGINRAHSEIIYFFDDDVVLEKKYLEKMQEIFETHPQFVGGMGTITNLEPYRFTLTRIFRKFFMLQRCYDSGKFTLSGMPTHPYGTDEFKKVKVLGGCCMAFRATVFKKYRFDENLRYYGYMEDADFSQRVSKKHQLFFNPAARLEHHESPENRVTLIDNRAMLMANYSYLFFKNVYPYHKWKILLYCWTVLGLFFEALFIMRNKNYLKGYSRGLLFSIKNEFKIPFIR